MQGDVDSSLSRRGHVQRPSQGVDRPPPVLTVADDPALHAIQARVLNGLFGLGEESSRVLLLAKDRRIRELQARVEQLEAELATCRGQLYHRL